ncbi:hypothetical protein BASA61_002065 [Batrachochytrium salamandrivorans]|nr:hypothetical protein BASA61_002065 [Batrachochytrium salamandrivorans]
MRCGNSRLGVFWLRAVECRWGERSGYNHRRPRLSRDSSAKGCSNLIPRDPGQNVTFLMVGGLERLEEAEESFHCTVERDRKHLRETVSKKGTWQTQHTKRSVRPSDTARSGEFVSVPLTLCLRPIHSPSQVWGASRFESKNHAARIVLH